MHTGTMAGSLGIRLSSMLSRVSMATTKTASVAADRATPIAVLAGLTAIAAEAENYRAEIGTGSGLDDPKSRLSVQSRVRMIQESAESLLRLLPNPEEMVHVRIVDEVLSPIDDFLKSSFGKT